MSETTSPSRRTDQPSAGRGGGARRVGRWRLLRQLGAGGMGAVHLGIDDAGGLAAIKVMHPHVADDDVLVGAFRREAALAAQVRSPRTARVIAVDFEAVPPYLAVEYVDGLSLRDHVGRYGPLAAHQLVPLAIGLTEALSAIHETGFVHRDLTPTNVLLTERGPKVVDFGIACRAGRSTPASTGRIMGTPGWLAPELILGDPGTPASDVFALGCLIVFAACGTSPFGNGPTGTLLDRTLRGTATDVPRLPAPLDALVPDALARDPRRRPPIATVLEHLIGHPGVHPSTPLTVVAAATGRDGGVAEIATQPIAPRADVGSAS